MSCKTLKEPPLLYVCVHKRFGGEPSCGERGGETLLKTMKSAISSQNLACDVEPITCLGQCRIGPNARIAGESILTSLDPNDPEPILEEIKKIS